MMGYSSHTIHIYGHVFICQLAMLFSVLSVDAYMTRYMWHTSKWEPCQGDLCGEEGHSSRQVTCMNTNTNRTVPHANCSGLSRPPSHKSCFLVCDLHQFQYHWQTSSWTSCQPRFGKVQCQEDFGIRYRNVTCVSRCGQRAPHDSLCASFTAKPAAKQYCQMECSRNCVVSEFSSWTDCGSCFTTHKSRYRTVLAAPRFGGKTCRDLVQHEMCQRDHTCFELRSTNFQYRLGNWSMCLELEGKLAKKLSSYSKVLGLQRRSVECTNVHGLSADEKFCSSISAAPRPMTQRLCVLSRDCLVSHWTTWSNWTSLHPPYPSGTSRDAYLPVTRHRKQMLPTTDTPGLALRERNLLEVPRGDGEKCPPLIDTRDQEPAQQNHQCGKYEWITGSWGACHTQVGELCGRGVQNRTVLCSRGDDRVPVEDYNCLAPVPKHTRKCDVSCPRDCLVSAWSVWGDCLPHKCTHKKVKAKGYLLRERKILEESQHGGDRCPHLQETQTCEYPMCYEWRPQQNASLCELAFRDRGCGHGTKHYAFGCYDVDGHQVSHELCGAPRPLKSEECYVPCPNDCVTSDWSEWSQCSQSCVSDSMPGYRSRHRVTLATASNDGKQCPRDTRQSRQYQKCGASPSCTTYHWRLSHWSKCYIGQPGLKCGVGTQSRIDRCHRSDGVEVQPKMCVKALRPITTRNCTIPCGKECVVSEFSDWSPCPVTCVAADSRALQSRIRFVLQQPDDGSVSSSCPALYETRPCDAVPRCLRYSWQVGGWSRCLLSGRCGAGYSVRDVHCVNSEREMPEEQICISELGNMPDVTEKCHVTCEENRCGFSDWSEWGACSDRCGGLRTRRRSQQAIPRSKDCYDRVLHPLEEKEVCHSCSRYSAQPVGNWSSCILKRDDVSRALEDGALYTIGLQRASEKLCGVGKRYHAMVCTDGHGHNTSSAVCRNPDFSEEMCFIMCPVDCEMSPWGEWSPCETQERCGVGTRRRYRYLKQEAVDGGRECAPMHDGEEYEHDLCHVPCPLYAWQVEHWSPCSLQLKFDGGPDCGPGLQTRSVKCSLLQPDGKGGHFVNLTAEKHCRHLPRPSDHNSNCVSPCLGQCVLSHWSEWSQCPHDCTGERMRSRSVMRQSSPSGGRCPERYQTDGCHLNLNCYTYAIRWSAWTNCQLRPGQQCGQGVQRSFGECVRSDGVLESMTYCSQGSPPGGGVRERRCDLPCAVDCVVSEWTPWSACNASCGLGLQRRGRHVIIQPRFGGRRCPDDMTQTRPCSYVECFKWSVSPWSECSIEEHSCGYGEQRRSLMCTRHDGERADPGLCPQGGPTFFQLRRPCFLACGGDCRVSEWSAWGLCHHSCAPGITEGQQTRSRSIVNPASTTGEQCPDTLRESRPCSDAACPGYEWRTSPWFGSRRRVWCQRRDGVHVQGGCNEAARPTDIKSCNPACDVINSYCRDVNQCSCSRGYRESYDESGKLKNCNKIIIMAEINSTNGEALYEYYPADGATNVWMYAVIAAGSAFVIFVVAAVYFVLKHSRKERLCEASVLQNTKSTLLRNTALNDSPEDQCTRSNPLLAKASDHDIHQTTIYKNDIT